MSVLRKWLCSLIEHNLTRSKKITNHIDEYVCTRCGQEFTNNGEGSIVEMTKKFKERNDVLQKMHLNKIARQKKMMA